MYNESLLIERLKSQTSYFVDYADDSTIDLINVNAESLPRVYVGHLGVKLESPEHIYANGFRELDNPCVLLTSIQFICQRQSLAEVRTNIANAYKNYSVFPNDSNYSSIFFVEANTVAKTNRNIWWQEVVGLVFPRVS